MSIQHLGASLFQPPPALMPSELTVPKYFYLTEQKGEDEPKRLFPLRGVFTRDEALNLLAFRMGVYDRIQGCSILAGHDDSYFDVWDKQGQRVALVRIECVEPAAQP